jgi:hypothetical protein
MARVALSLVHWSRGVTVWHQASEQSLGIWAQPSSPPGIRQPRHTSRARYCMQGLQHLRPAYEIVPSLRHWNGFSLDNKSSGIRSVLRFRLEAFHDGVQASSRNARCYREVTRTSTLFSCSHPDRSRISGKHAT